MTKKTAMWLMIAGAGVSLWDAFSGGSLYGPGRPLASLKWKVWTTASGANYYVSISDLVAVAGAVIYFSK